MMNKHDIELLRRYVKERSEDAFTELVRERIGLVYSAALRQVGGDASLAEEVTQTVFSDLARKAPGLLGHTSLAGWLFTSARYAAAAARRSNQRRTLREQAAHDMNPLPQSADSHVSWDDLRPVIDEAMHDLKSDDREAVLLRYFDGVPLAALGERFGISENAARMRVDRAMDRLRAALVKRGVTSTSAALAGTLAGQAIGAVPAGLAASISKTALVGAASASGLSLLLARLSTGLKIKLAAGAAAIFLLAALPLLHSTPRAAAAADSNSATHATVAVSNPAPSATLQSPAEPVKTTQASVIAGPLDTVRLTLLAADVNKPIPDVQLVCETVKGGQTNEQTLTATRQGVCNVPYPRQADALRIATRKDGFADTYLQWEPALGDAVPTQYSAHLVRAAHIGGYVQEDNGAPLAGIKVILGRNEMQVDKAALLSHEHREIKNFSIFAMTDAHGRWTLDRIAPETIGRCILAILDERFEFKFDPCGETNVQAALLSGSHLLTLHRNDLMHGVVVDAEGRPIAGARVANDELGRSAPSARTRSGADGAFSIRRDHDWPTLLSITAGGYVSKIAKYDPSNTLDSVRIVLEHGHELNVQVVDQLERPVEGALLAAEEDGNYAILDAKTGADGIATLHEAPAGSMRLFVNVNDVITNVIVAVDGTLQRIVVTRENAAMSNTVTVTVTDADTGRPIPRGAIVEGAAQIMGRPLGGSGDDAEIETTTNFAAMERSWRPFSGGKCAISLSKEGSPLFPAPMMGGWMLKAQADGYAAGLSRVISLDETNAVVEIALKPAKPIKATVLNPDGTPASQTDVGLASGAMIIIKADHLEAPNSPTAILRSDAMGKVTIPPDDSGLFVIAINSQGFAFQSAAALKTEPVIQLQKFGTARGRVTLNGQPAVGMELTFSPAWRNGISYVLDPGRSNMRTDSDGRYTTTPLPPGKYRVMLSRGEPPNLALEFLGETQIQPGETETLDFAK